MREGKKERARPGEVAPSFFLRACEGGDWRACGVLGDAYDRGHGVAEDPERAAALFVGR